MALPKANIVLIMVLDIAEGAVEVWFQTKCIPCNSKIWNGISMCTLWNLLNTLLLLLVLILTISME